MKKTYIIPNLKSLDMEAEQMMAGFSIDKDGNATSTPSAEINEEVTELDAKDFRW